MSVPKSVVKVKKGGVEYTSNVDAAEYYIFELNRAALRDVGKFVRKKWKEAFYSSFKKQSGDAGRATSQAVLSSKNTKYPRVELGLKTGKVDGFYAYFQEFGTSKTPKLGILRDTVESNVAQIVEIESKYLSALEDEAQALALIDESEHIDED
jgi:HK97 gp10 family phage protein